MKGKTETKKKQKAENGLKNETLRFSRHADICKYKVSNTAMSAAEMDGETEKYEMSEEGKKTADKRGGEGEKERRRQGGKALSSVIRK